MLHAILTILTTPENKGACYNFLLQDACLLTAYNPISRIQP